MSLDIGVACILLAAAILVFMFGVHEDASDSAPHRTGPRSIDGTARRHLR